MPLAISVLEASPGKHPLMLTQIDEPPHAQPEGKLQLDGFLCIRKPL